MSGADASDRKADDARALVEMCEELLADLDAVRDSVRAILEAAVAGTRPDADRFAALLGLSLDIGYARDDLG